MVLLEVGQAIGLVLLLHQTGFVVAGAAVVAGAVVDVVAGVAGVAVVVHVIL